MSNECTHQFEHTMSIKGSEYRKHQDWSSVSTILVLKNIYSKVELTELTFSAMTIATEHPGILCCTVIPSSKNTDAHSGTSAAIINQVKDRRIVPTGTTAQHVMEGVFDLSGFETDLAQDAKRGAIPVMWLGNTKKVDATTTDLLQVTFRATFKCSGTSVLW